MVRVPLTPPDPTRYHARRRPPPRRADENSSPGGSNPMRRERWIAVLLIAGAVSIGALAGCGQKAQEKDDEDIMAGAPTPTTTATTDTSAKPGAVSMALGEQVVQTNCV